MNSPAHRGAYPIATRKTLFTIPKTQKNKVLQISRRVPDSQDSQEESERATKHPEWNPEPSSRAHRRIRIPLRDDWILRRSASP